MYGFERLMATIDEGKGLDANSLLEKLMGDMWHDLSCLTTRV